MGAAKKSWDEMMPAQQAGILANDPQFRRFLTELMSGVPVDNAMEAAWAIRSYCRVESRSQIVRGTPSAERWNHLVGDYRMWQVAPKLGIGEAA